MALIMLAATICAAEEESPLLGKQAPNFVLKDTNGKEWRLSSLRWKKVVVLDFGRTVCVPCRDTAKGLQGLHAKYASKGLQVFAVNLDGPKANEQVADYTKEAKLTFPFLRDVRFEAAQLYRVPKIPHVVIIDRSGKVRYVHTGFNDDLVKTLEKEIVPLLPKKP